MEQTAERFSDPPSRVLQALRRGSVFTSGSATLFAAGDAEEDEDASGSTLPALEDEGIQEAVARRQQRAAAAAAVASTVRGYIHAAGTAAAPLPTPHAPRRVRPPPPSPAQLARVCSLDLAACTLKREHLAILAQVAPSLRALRSLSLARNYLLGKDMGRMLESLIALPQAQRPPLASLDLSGNVLGAHTMHASLSLSRLLLPEMGRRDADPPLPHLAHLNLRNAQMGDAQLAPIVDALRSNRRLRSLVLSENGLRDKTALSLSEAFSHGNLALETLDMSVNDLSAEGARALGEAVAARGSRLQALDLSMNVLGDRGCVALCEAIAPGCAIGEELANAPAALPKGALSLRALGLSSCHIGDRGALALGALVARCAALTSLIIDNNAWSFGATNAVLSTLIKERKIQQLGMV